MKVVKVAEWFNQAKDKPQWYVTLEDGTEAVSFSEKARDLAVDMELPEGWSLEAPKQAGWKPMLKAPQQKGGGGGYKGLSAAEKASLDGYIQERMDRRTALMTAKDATDIPARILPLADEFYAWLRATAPEPSSLAGAGSGNEGTGASTRTSPAPVPSQSSVPGESAYRTPTASPSTPETEGQSEAGAQALGEGAEAPATDHVHDWKPAPRAGFVMCSVCGNAQKAVA